MNELKELAKHGSTKITLTSEELAQAHQIQNAIRAEAIVEIKNDIAAYRRKSYNPEAKDRMLKFLNDTGQDAAFFMLIFAPCWLIYRTSPSQLYRKARQGDYLSIEKLLELDPLMIHDPYIGRAIQRFRFRRKTHLYRKLMEIPGKEVTGRVTSQQVKYALGGFLSAFAKLAGQKLTAPDIKRLYDAVAKDFDDQLEDHELPVGDTFARAISRYRIDWLKALKSDMKK